MSDQVRIRHARLCPDKWKGLHQRLYVLVARAVDDAFNAHPDYLTDKGHHSAARSVSKRVTGQIVGVIKEAQKRGAKEPSRRHARRLPSGSAGETPDQGILAVLQARKGRIAARRPAPACRSGVCQ